MSVLLNSWLNPFQNSPTSHNNYLDHDRSIRSHLESIERRQADLQRHLQFLLDTQEERLLQSSVEEDARTTASSVMTTVKVMPVRQPHANMWSLNAVRREITMAMRELAKMKKEELHLLNLEAERNTAAVGQIEAWQHRSEQVGHQIDRINEEQESQRVKSLKQEGDCVQEQINALEIRLSELKSQQRTINFERINLENAVESKLSSYKQSLKLINEETARFVQSFSRDFIIPDDTSLHPRRWTLPMIHEQVQETETRLERRLVDADQEQQALIQGSDVWQEALAKISDLEVFISSNLRSSDPHAAEDLSKTLAERIKTTIEALENYIDISRSQRWNLLLCCLGAETQALLQARAYLGWTSDTSYD